MKVIPGAAPAGVALSLAAALSLGAVRQAPAPSAPSYDIVIRNGRVLDGAGNPWVPADIASIDAALAKAMSDNDLQSVIQQYYDVPISSRMLPSVVLRGSAPATIYKDQVEAVVARICRYGALDGADTGSTVINILLPRGVVLVDGFTAGFQPPPGQEAEHECRRRAVVKVGGEDLPASDAEALEGSSTERRATLNRLLFPAPTRIY